MIRCIQCSSIITGVEDKNGDGFARCPVCDRRLYLEFGADPVNPLTGPKAKATAAHRETTQRMLEGRIFDKVTRERPDMFSEDSWRYGGFRRALAQADDVERRPAAPAASLPPTVKKLDIFGNVIDTYQTEAELNGWKAKQGRLI